MLAYRGSNNIRNFFTDSVFPKQDCGLVTGCQVHVGFGAAWDELAAQTKDALNATLSANPGYRVIATGHSLGGATATLAAAYLRRDGIPMDTYTYGSPRVGNGPFADFVTNQPGADYRITHTDDPAPRVLDPIYLGYRHTSPEYWFHTGTSTTTNYNITDVRVCEGSANKSCNGGEFGFNLIAHLYYFEYTYACAGFALQWKRDDVITAKGV